MRKLILCVLTAILAVIIAARLRLPEPAEYVMALPDPAEYNTLFDVPPEVTETAGSAVIGELHRYFFSREPTAKNAWTGALTGKNLILICAEGWAPAAEDRQGSPAAFRLAAESMDLPLFYLPDWYQGADGRLFALLTGLTPTRVNDGTALERLGDMGTYLPFTLARVLGGRGYDTQAYIRQAERLAAFRALGFARSFICTGPALEDTMAAAAALPEGTPFFLFLEWPAKNCGDALDWLLRALEDRGLADGTALCLLTGGGAPERGRLLLRAPGLDVSCADPCSDLDVTPTLLNLFAADYDARLLSGRDILADTGDPMVPSALTPLVSLSGSAYADWITDAGRFRAQSRAFLPDRAGVFDQESADAYVQAVCRLQYDRYVFARRIMETDYFRILFPSK